MSEDKYFLKHRCSLILFLLCIANLCFSRATVDANFRHSIVRGELKVNFIDLSTPVGQITSWNWEFGDGFFSTLANPQHTYAAAGEYTVKLTVRSGADQDIYSKTISVTNDLKALFTMSKSSGTVPLDVDFNSETSTGPIVTQLWTVSPGNIGVEYEFTSGANSSMNPSIKFKTTGIYTITLKVTAANGQVNTAVAQYVSVGAGLSPKFSNSTPVYVGQQVQFTDNTVYPCPGQVTYTWTFPNGTRYVANPTYTFASEGTYPVKLCVIDACGNNNCVIKNITVKTPPNNIFAQFYASKLQIRKGETVTFTDTSTPQPSIAAWFWDFELPRDYPTEQSKPADLLYYSPRQSVTHTYNTVGIYKVRLQVTPNVANLGTFCEAIIEVRDSPELIKSMGLTSVIADASLSGNFSAFLGASYSPINVYRKIGASESKQWDFKETWDRAIGWGSNYPIFNEIQVKGNNLLLMMNRSGVTTYKVIKGIGELSGVQYGNGGFETSDLVAAPSSGRASMNIIEEGNEFVILQQESNGIYLYRWVQGTYFGAGYTVQKIKVQDGSASYGRVFIDNNVIVAHVDQKVIIYERAGGVWNFDNKIVIDGFFKAVSYANNTIVTTPQSAAIINDPVARVYTRGLNGWMANQAPIANLYLEDQDVLSSTSITIPDSKSVGVSENYVALNVVLNLPTPMSRMYVFKRFYNTWVDSKQTYKITGATGQVEMSNYDVLSGKSIYNLENYCLAEPFELPTFTINNQQLDVAKGVINLGGTGTSVFTANARANYYGKTITLKPGITITSGARVNLKAVASCDELYFK